MHHAASDQSPHADARGGFFEEWCFGVFSLIFTHLVGGRKTDKSIVYVHVEVSLESGFLSLVCSALGAMVCSLT